MIKVMWMKNAKKAKNAMMTTNAMKATKIAGLYDVVNTMDLLLLMVTETDSYIPLDDGAIHVE